MIPNCTSQFAYSGFRPATPQITEAAASNTPAAKKVKEPTGGLFQQILGLPSLSEPDQTQLLLKIKKSDLKKPSKAVHQVFLCFLGCLTSSTPQDSLSLKSDFSHGLRFLPADFCTHFIMELFEATLESSALFFLENGISEENKPLVYSQTLKKLAQKKNTALVDQVSSLLAKKNEPTLEEGGSKSLDFSMDPLSSPHLAFDPSKISEPLLTIHSPSNSPLPLEKEPLKASKQVFPLTAEMIEIKAHSLFQRILNMPFAYEQDNRGLLEELAIHDRAIEGYAPNWIAVCFMSHFKAGSDEERVAFAQHFKDSLALLPEKYALYCILQLFIEGFDYIAKYLLEARQPDESPLVIYPNILKCLIKRRDINALAYDCLFASLDLFSAEKLWLHLFQSWPWKDIEKLLQTSISLEEKRPIWTSFLAALRSASLSKNMRNNLVLLLQTQLEQHFKKEEGSNQKEHFKKFMQHIMSLPS